MAVAEIPVNMLIAPIFSTNDPINPAMKFASAENPNQIPIINDKYRAGASLVTIDSPVGDKHSSPTV